MEKSATRSKRQAGKIGVKTKRKKPIRAIPSKTFKPLSQVIANRATVKHERSPLIGSLLTRIEKWGNQPFAGKLGLYLVTSFTLSFIPSYPFLIVLYVPAMLFLLMRGITILLRAKKLEFFDYNDTYEDGKQREYAALAILWSAYTTILAIGLLIPHFEKTLGVILVSGILFIPPLIFFFLSLRASERSIWRVIKGKLLKTVACICSNYFGLFLILILALAVEILISWGLLRTSNILGIATSESAIQTVFSLLDSIDWKLWIPIMCYVVEKFAILLVFFLSTTIATMILFIFLTPLYQLHEMKTALSLTAGFSAFLSIGALVWSFLFADTISTYYLTLDPGIFGSIIPNSPFSQTELILEYGKQFGSRDFTGTVSNLLLVYTLGIVLARLLLERRATHNAKMVRRIIVELMQIIENERINNDLSCTYSKLKPLYKELKYRSTDLVVLPEEISKTFERRVSETVSKKHYY